MNLILLIGLVVTMAFNAEAAPFCWDIGASPAASADIATPTPAGTHCHYTHTYGTYGSFRRLMWPTSAYAAATTSNCPASATCIVASTPAATVASLPAVSSCYSGSYSASTLSSQTTATCTTSVYCIATFAASTTLANTLVSASVVSACSALACTPSATVLCSLVANTNQVLGCYVGVYYQSTSSTTMIASICAPIASGATFVSASYCQSTYQWSSSNGYTITGACVATCAAEAVLATGTVATRGVVCSGSIYGNPASYSSCERVNFNLFVIVSAFLLLGLNLLF